MDVPLWRTVAVVGVSGSGKTSLAMGTLYAEGLHRFLEGLSTYSRRRLTQAQRPDVDRIEHLPPALALRQRPPVPGPRSTVGTMSERFLITRVCSVCHGTRLRPEALASRLGGRNLAEISALSLGELRGFAAGLPAGLPAELSRMTTGLLAELTGRLTPLLDVGLGYLALDRAGASLSTGERQRIELTSTVRASTTGMLYVLDEPSVGLHPSNVAGLLKTITALAGNGNSVVVVEHEREIIRSRRLGHRARPRSRHQGRHGDRPGPPRPAGGRPGLDHGPVPGRRRGRDPGPSGTVRSRRADHPGNRGPVQPARRHRRLPGRTG